MKTHTIKSTKKKVSQKRSSRLLKKRRRQVLLQKILLLVLLFLLIGAAGIGLIFLRKKAVSPSVNSACENYRPDVEQIAAEYDMSDYTDLILALMMQESSGHGADIMQSSEGAYNTEYPQEPNGITDVDYSIRCGIQELKYAMQKAGVTSPSDISHIKLALQAYNFGADSYFNYLRNHGITEWSVSSSEAFAQMASGNTARSQEDIYYNTAGPWDYGDQYYPEHVLRYYHPK